MSPPGRIGSNDPKSATARCGPSVRMGGVGDEEAVSAYDTCLAELEKLENQVRRGILLPCEYEHRAVTALATYFEDEGAGDDVDFLVSYTREQIASWAENPLDGDREATDRFDVHLQRNLHLPVARANLNEILEQVRTAIAAGDQAGVETLIELCGTGRRAHLRVFLFEDLIKDAIRTARELGVVAALMAAVDPRDHGWHQLGHPDHYSGRPRTLVFESLAELAAQRSPVGDQALDALVELCRHLQTAALASVHIPAYRLNNEQRASLLDSAAAIDDLMAADVFHLPAYDANRAPNAIRSVLWLANDASRVSH